jgi:tetratricopeptide (TPR) repeat protein
MLPASHSIIFYFQFFCFPYPSFYFSHNFQNYLARHRLISEALFQFGRNAPSSAPHESDRRRGDQTEPQAHHRWDGGLNAVRSHLSRMLHIDPLDKHAWFLFAAASYSLCLLSPAPALKAHPTSQALQHALDLHTEERVALQRGLDAARKGRKDPAKPQAGKEKDDEDVLVRRAKGVEEKLFFLRLALSDCCLLKGGEQQQQVDEGLRLANEAASEASLAFAADEDGKKEAEAFCHRQLARCHFAQRKVDLAIKEYKEAIKIRGSFLPAPLPPRVSYRFLLHNRWYSYSIAQAIGFRCSGSSWPSCTCRRISSMRPSSATSRSSRSSPAEGARALGSWPC